MKVYDALKRLFDAVFSLAVLLLGAPFFLIIALAVKVSSKGPIFFSSIRVGMRFKPISCLKFRTMYVGAETRLAEIINTDSDLKKEWELFQKLKKDPRITPLGRFLRKASLDELPQFFNVLTGDLSVVGPRPFTYNQIEDYLGTKAEKILSAKPGITGLWQVSGRNLLTIEKRLELEERYIERRSFFYDLLLIAKTIPVFFFQKGAF